jgi:hypothetical protein
MERSLERKKKGEVREERDRGWGAACVERIWTSSGSLPDHGWMDGWVRICRRSTSAATTPCSCPALATTLTCGWAFGELLSLLLKVPLLAFESSHLAVLLPSSPPQSSSSPFYSSCF